MVVDEIITALEATPDSHSPPLGCSGSLVAQLRIVRKRGVLIIYKGGSREASLLQGMRCRWAGLWVAR